MEKIHPTPDEVEVWQIEVGDRIQTFDTSEEQVDVQICYDAEFPEVSRIMADQGLQILFVPFLTDSRAGFLRVNH